MIKDCNFSEARTQQQSPGLVSIAKHGLVRKLLHRWTDNLAQLLVVS